MRCVNFSKSLLLVPNLQHSSPSVSNENSWTLIHVLYTELLGSAGKEKIQIKKSGDIEIIEFNTQLSTS